MRVFGAVLLGYLATFAVVAIGLSLLYFALGADRAFQPGTYDVSLLWIAISTVVAFLAALLGGWIARRVTRDGSGPRALAATIFVLGLLLALSSLFVPGEAPGVRAGDVSNFEAMQQAQSPLWILLLNPVIGALGVLTGGRAPRGHRGSVLMP